MFLCLDRVSIRVSQEVFTSRLSSMEAWNPGQVVISLVVWAGDSHSLGLLWSFSVSILRFRSADAVPGPGCLSEGK